MPPHPSAISPHPSTGGLPPVIGFAGRAGAGKTTAALCLVATMGYCLMSFADPLRDMLRAVGLTAEDLSAGKEIPHLLLGGKTPRFALQTLGTEWGRKTISEELWIGLARHRLNRALDAGERIVFDDVRFANEAQMVRVIGGIVIHIDRPGLPPISQAHASEAGLPAQLIDHHVSADSPEELQTKLHAILNSHPSGVAA